jgi:hypothetical protein
MRNEQEADLRLADDVADLLSERRNEPFLRALFRRQKGGWSSLPELCREASIEPPATAVGHVHVGWLDDPDETPGYALVIFVAMGELQSTIAIYNRARLLGAEAQ